MKAPRLKIIVLRLCMIATLGLYPAGLAAENPPAVQLAGGETELTRHNEVRRLTQSDAPSFVKRNLPDYVNIPSTLLFTYQDPITASGPVYSSTLRGTQQSIRVTSRIVTIAFAHEGWSVLHPLALVRNTDTAGQTYPVFFIYYDLQREIQERLLSEGKNLEYRFVVDGVWMADPKNPLNIRKMNGALVSYVDLNTAPIPPVQSPEVKPLATQVRSRTADSETAALSSLASSRRTRQVFIRWVGPPGQEVYVSGTFNSFDPWMTSLKPVGADRRNPSRIIYEVELRLLAGQYYYHFVINGSNTLDPLNVRQGFGPEGRTYSILPIE